ncbi:MAG: cyclic nucleotide-binding domain-containing protein [Lachnospiraceae bacterium]|nr:cyclic nucleotide-binding domain-containing protein [Lachnospiraceae bacterium]
MLFRIPAGITILKEGEVNPELYKLISGNCEVYTGYGTERESILGILSKGAYFGEIGFFSGKPSIYTVVAYTDVMLERIETTEFQKYVTEHYEDMLALMKNMTESMYNLRFNMELMAKDAERNKRIVTADTQDISGDLDTQNSSGDKEAIGSTIRNNDAYLREQLKKYNLMGMKSITFYTAKG